MLTIRTWASSRGPVRREHAERRRQLHALIVLVAGLVAGRPRIAAGALKKYCDSKIAELRRKSKTFSACRAGRAVVRQTCGTTSRGQILRRVRYALAVKAAALNRALVACALPIRKERIANAKD